MKDPRIQVFFLHSLPVNTLLLGLTAKFEQAKQDVPFLPIMGYKTFAFGLGLTLLLASKVGVDIRVRICDKRQNYASLLVYF